MGERYELDEVDETDMEIKSGRSKALISEKVKVMKA